MSIEIRDVTVRFGGITALSNASLTLEPGRIISVIGPNGSGKSTMFNAITGMVKPIAGTVIVDGVVADALSPSQRISLGLARTFQTPRFDPQITVEEAVLCGFYPVRKSGVLGSMLRLPKCSAEERHFLRRCHEILDDLKLLPLKDMQMGELPMGRVRLVEVARAVANEPRYILLDEPAAGLSLDEQRMLAGEIRRLAERGVGVLLVEHNFKLVRDLAEYLMVLKQGACLIEGDPERVASDPSFIEAYLGRAA